LRYKIEYYDTQNPYYPEEQTVMKNTHPKKFALIGLPGSGKSTFASKLGKILGIPVHHLDRHMFEPGGKKGISRNWKNYNCDDCQYTKTHSQCPFELFFIHGGYGEAWINVRGAALETVCTGSIYDSTLHWNFPTRLCKKHTVLV